MKTGWGISDFKLTKSTSHSPSGAYCLKTVVITFRAYLTFYNRTALYYVINRDLLLLTWNHAIRCRICSKQKIMMPPFTNRVSFPTFVSVACLSSVFITPHKVSASHYNDVIMSALASQITSLTIVYSIIYSSRRSKKTSKPASLAFMRGIYRWPVNSPHKGPVTRKMFPFDDVIIFYSDWYCFEYIIRPFLLK